MTAEEFWKKYLKETGKPENTPFSGELSFGEDPEESSFLILQIMQEKKTVFSSSYYSFEIDRVSLPKKGNVYVITDWQDTPYAIIETIDVTTLPFNCVPWSLAKKEGEADTMKEWQELKSEFFEYDADVMGYNFSQTMPVVFEEFKVVYRNS